MNKTDIIRAHVRIREIDNTIPDDVLEFMKQAAIEKLGRQGAIEELGSFVSAELGGIPGNFKEADEIHVNGVRYFNHKLVEKLTQPAMEGFVFDGERGLKLKPVKLQIKLIEEIRNSLSNIWEFNVKGKEENVRREISYIRKLLREEELKDIPKEDLKAHYKFDVNEGSTIKGMDQFAGLLLHIGFDEVEYLDEDKPETVMQKVLRELSDDIEKVYHITNKYQFSREDRIKLHEILHNVKYNLRHKGINGYCEGLANEKANEIFKDALSDFSIRHEKVIAIDFYNKLGEKLDRIQAGTLDLKDYTSHVKNKRLDLIKNL